VIHGERAIVAANDRDTLLCPRKRVLLHLPTDSERCETHRPE